MKKTLHATAKRLLQSAQDHVAGVDVNELLIPASVIESMLEALSIPINQLNAETSKKQRNAIVQWLKYCALHAIGRGSGAEFVTAGGVELSEVDPSTMQSRINPRVFFAGEVLNYDGYTGGFNLQAAWATGNIAGQNVLSAL